MYLICLGLFVLIAAHCFGDYVFQNDYIARKKYNSFLILVTHCILYTAACMIGLIIVDVLLGLKLGDFQYFLLMLVLVSSHFIFDIMKINAENNLKSESEETQIKYLWLDQLAHLAIIVLLYVVLVVKMPWT